jgi:hypothetical protein
MKLTRLALALALAAPAASFAVEYMEDDSLSSVTGQDGIGIALSLDVTVDLRIEDDNGVTNSLVYGNTDVDNAGAIYIDNANINTGLNPVEVAIDAGGDDPATGAQLEVYITLPAGTTMTTGDLYVQNTDGAFGVEGTSQLIMSSTTVTLGGGAELALELGAEETAFLEIANGNIGSITMGAGSLADATDATNNTINWAAIDISALDLSGTTVDVVSDSIEVVLPAGTLNGTTVQITDLTFGTDPWGGPVTAGVNDGVPIGDVEIVIDTFTSGTINIFGLN